MTPKLKTILLVDDDEATNFIHKMIIKQMNCTENIVVKENGIEAIEYLKSSIDGIHPQPDLIFLDINMPAMDGWEFLQEYDKLKVSQQAKTIIVMLSTSLNPSDRDTANSIPLISGFITKPLTAEKLADIHETHFRACKELEKS